MLARRYSLLNEIYINFRLLFHKYLPKLIQSICATRTYAIFLTKTKRIMLRKKKSPFPATFSQGYEKKKIYIYMIIIIIIIITVIKAVLQVSSARLHDFVCIVNIAIRTTKFQFNYFLFLKLLFIPALKKLVLVTTYVSPTKLSQAFNGKDI